MIGDLISAGAKLVGGLFDRNQAKENVQLQLQNAAMNRAQEKEFAQMGVRWRVEDARAAKINPLAALGASVATSSPVSIGTLPEGNMSSTLGGMGADIGRAVNATMTAPERAANGAKSLLELQGMKLDNDIKRAAFASSLQRIIQNNNPPFPSGDFAVPENKKSEERPPLMLFGKRMYTPSGTSPMKAWEDQIGDDGPLSWLMQLAVGGHMVQHNIEKYWPKGSIQPLDSWYDKVTGWFSRGSSQLGGRRK